MTEGLISEQLKIVGKMAGESFCEWEERQYVRWGKNPQYALGYPLDQKQFPFGPVAAARERDGRKRIGLSDGLPLNILKD